MAKSDKTKPELTSSFELLGPSTKLIRKYVGVFFVLLVLPVILTSIDSQSENLFSPFLLAGGLLYLVFMAPLIYAETRVAGGHSVSLEESFKKGFPYFWRLLVLLIATGMMIFVGLLLFVIPGLILARRYMLAPYFLVDRNLGIGEALDLSAKESKPFSWSIYGIIGVTFIIALMNIFGVIGLIASTILSVLYALAPALRYHEIKKAYKAL